MSTIELIEQAKHQDWMEQMESINHQLDLMNQNLSGLAMIFGSLSEEMAAISTQLKTKKVKTERANEKVQRG